MSPRGVTWGTPSSLCSPLPPRPGPGRILSGRSCSGQCSGVRCSCPTCDLSGLSGHVGSLNSRIEEREERFQTFSMFPRLCTSTAARLGSDGSAGAISRRNRWALVSVSMWTSVVVRRSTKPRREPRYFWWAAGERQRSAPGRTQVDGHRRAIAGTRGHQVQDPGPPGEQGRITCQERC